MSRIERRAPFDRGNNWKPAGDSALEVLVKVKKKIKEEHGKDRKKQKRRKKK